MTVPITAIINLSMREGVFPPAFKQALVTPLIKRKHFAGINLSPISNLSFLSKILKKIIAKRLNAHLEEHLLSNHVQSAYKPTTKRTIRTISDIYQGAREVL